MGGSLESWDEVAPRLAASRRVLRYDTRGAGLSEKVRGALSIDTMVDDLAALMDALGITGKVALAGIAVGGAIALHAAARLPQRIAAAVVGSPATGIAPDRRAAVLARVDCHRARGHAQLGRRLDGQRLRARAARAIPPALPLFAPAGSATIRPATPPSIACWPAWTCSRSWQRIACPVLVLGGSLDRVRPPALAEPVARSIPGARYQVLETGHYMAVATPELVATAIGDFLDEVGA